jgi:hypothetical protein
VNKIIMAARTITEKTVLYDILQVLGEEVKRGGLRGGGG